MSLYELIKENRVAKGLSRAQLAKMAGVSVDAIYAWETGKRTPTIECADKIFKVLGVTYTIGA